MTYTLTDPNGMPLDAAGVTTPGTVSLSYIAAVIPNGQEDYTAYTTRAATGTVIATTQQPGADSGGVTTLRAGAVYLYVPHHGACGIRCDGHPYHRHLWIAQPDGV